MSGDAAPSRPAGQRLLELVEVMDRLRSPGGCPWDAEQTHTSLLRYLLEETYETIEAVEGGDRAHLREELGDLLLQVVFHARIAAEHPADPFGIDEVAAGITEKLIRRHPHVFAAGQDEAPGTAVDAAAVEATWEALKAAEKGRASAVDGVPLAQPALALAAKLQDRVARAGFDLAVQTPQLDPEADLGEALFGLVAVARARGLDPEAELRRAAREFAGLVRAVESGTAGR